MTTFQKCVRATSFKHFYDLFCCIRCEIAACCTSFFDGPTHKLLHETQKKEIWCEIAQCFFSGFVCSCLVTVVHSHQTPSCTLSVRDLNHSAGCRGWTIHATVAAVSMQIPLSLQTHWKRTDPHVATYASPCAWHINILTRSKMFASHEPSKKSKRLKSLMQTNGRNAAAAFSRQVQRVWFEWGISREQNP